MGGSHWARLVGAMAFGIVACSAFGQAPSLTLIPPPAGRAETFATGLSIDGSTVVGYTRETGAGNYRGFTWTRSGGINEWGNSVPLSTQSFGVSSNGSLSIGTRRFADATSFRSEAYRYSTGSGYQTLGAVPAPFTDSTGTGVSGDGSVIVGALGRTGTSAAMRWTAAGGMQSLGTALPGDVYSGFNGLSRDGSTAIGISAPDFNGNEAYSWTRAGGWRHLSAPASAGANYDANPNAVNFDGSLIVGRVDPLGSAPQIPVLWQNGIPTELGMFGPNFSASANGLSDDGRIIVGGATDTNTGLTRATIWLEGASPMFLQDYLESLGVATPIGWTLRAAGQVSADGLTIIGSAQNGSTTRGFIATIPSPSGAAVVLVGLTYFTGSRRRR